MYVVTYDNVIITDEQFWGMNVDMPEQYKISQIQNQLKKRTKEKDKLRKKKKMICVYKKTSYIRASILL